MNVYSRPYLFNVSNRDVVEFNRVVVVFNRILVIMGSSLPYSLS